MSTVMPLTARQHFLAEHRAGVRCVTRPDEPAATPAVPVRYDDAPPTVVSVITSSLLAEAAALDAADLVPMAARHFGDEGGRVDAHESDDPADLVEVVKPEHRRTRRPHPDARSPRDTVKRSKENDT